MKKSAFTLIEMFIIIAIITVIIAMMLPALSSVRAISNRTKCTNNLRQIGILSQDWSIIHKGYLPLDGEIILDPKNSHNVSAAVNDGSKLRYEYTSSITGSSTDVDTPFVELPTPFVACLSMSLLKDRTTLRPSGTWLEEFKKHPSLSIFQCSSVNSDDRLSILPNKKFDGGPSLIVVVGQIGYYTSWWTASDYATNGILLGFHYDTAKGFFAGKIDRVKYPSNTLLMSDARGWIQVWNSDSTSGDINLTELRQSAIIPKIDLIRHKNKINVLFVDGHVETSSCDRDSLKKILLRVNYPQR